MLLRCVVYSISLGEVVNNNWIIETDNLPLGSLDPDLKVYGEHIPYPEPPFDSRGWELIITNSMNDDPHPVYPSLLTYQITYALNRLSNEKLYESVDTMNIWADNQLMPNTIGGSRRQRQNKLLNKKILAPLTQDEEDYLDEMDNIADYMDSNADNADQMKDFIENNTTSVPDFDYGWIISIE